MLSFVFLLRWFSAGPVLMVATFETRKNHALLFRAFERESRELISFSSEKTVMGPLQSENRYPASRGGEMRCAVPRSRRSRNAVALCPCACPGPSLLGRRFRHARHRGDGVRSFRFYLPISLPCAKWPRKRTLFSLLIAMEGLCIETIERLRYDSAYRETYHLLAEETIALVHLGKNGFAIDLGVPAGRYL